MSLDTAIMLTACETHAGLKTGGRKGTRRQLASSAHGEEARKTCSESREPRA